MIRLVPVDFMGSVQRRLGYVTYPRYPGLPGYWSTQYRSASGESAAENSGLPGYLEYVYRVFVLYPILVISKPAIWKLDASSLFESQCLWERVPCPEFEYFPFHGVERSVGVTIELCIRGVVISYASYSIPIQGSQFLSWAM